MVRWTGRVMAIVLVVVLVTAVAGGGSAASSSETSQPAPVALDLTFRPVVRYANGHCDPSVLTSGRYALVASGAPSGCATSFVLIDDRTGKRTVIHEPGFTELAAFGAPWIFFQTTPRDVLYNIATKQTRRCGRSQCQPSGGAIGYALGSRWLETVVRQPGWCGVGDPDQCGPITQSFYNINSGHLDDSSPPNDTTVADLNSRRLFHPVCPPLQVPPGGSLAFYGSFAMATEGGSSLLERCGTNLQIPIGISSPAAPQARVFANRHAVIWQILDQTGSWHGQFAGILLPSLRPFTATVPAALQNAGAVPVGLTAFRLYVWDSTGRLWAARMPR
jgi:hypothetical protein